MAKRNPKNDPVVEPTELESKVKKTDPMREHIAAELEKAELRLQKKYAKTLVAQEEEIRRLREELAKEKENRVHVVLQKFGEENS